MGYKIAVLGGDERELRVAERLRDDGHDVAVYGIELPGAHAFDAQPSAEDAVKGAQWIICPGPGIGAGNELYTPNWSEPVVFDEQLMAAADLGSGGIVLGRLPERLREVTSRNGYRVFESKDARHLSIGNATAVAEGLLKGLIELTDRVLRDYRWAVQGYGATGQVIVDYLLAVGARPTLIARDLNALERARQRGAVPHLYDDRIAALAGAEIAINTVPDTSAVPESAYEPLASSGTLLVDIASPPGGMDHAAAEAAGVTVHWFRGLGSRAPVTCGDVRYGFAADAIASVGA